MAEITVAGPDGAIHYFPEGTQEDVIDRVMRKHYGQAPEQQAILAQEAAATAGSRRSALQRFWQNAVDTYQTSALAESWRAGRLEGAQLAAGEITMEEINRRDGKHGDIRDIANIGNPIRDLGRAAGSLGQAIQPNFTLKEAQSDVDAERQRREDFAAVNANGDSFLRYAREGDYAGLAGHGLAALGGVLAGSAVDPISYITGGRTVIARALIQGGVAGAADVAAQDASVDIGIEENFSQARLLLSAAAGAGFSIASDLGGASIKAIRDRFFRHAEADIAADLDVADDLHLPALSEADVEPAPRLSADTVRTVIHPETGQEITLRGPGSPIDLVEGGVRPGDYVEDGMVYREAPKVLGGPEAKPGTDLTTSSIDPGGTGGGGQPPRDNVPAIPGEPEAKPSGDGQGGWDDVDWGKRLSPERAEAAIKHLDKLKKAIKPEHVEAFVRRLDSGIDNADEGRFVNERWVDWDSFKGKPEELLGLENVLSDVFGDLYTAAGKKVQGHKATRAIAKRMGVAYSDVVKAHADVTGEGGLTVKMMASQDLFLASVDDAVSKMRSIRENLRNGVNADDVKELAELVQRTSILGAMDASLSSEVARALQVRQMMTQPRSVVNDLQAAMDALNSAMQTDGLRTPADVEAVLNDLVDGYDKKGAAGLNSRLRKMKAMGWQDYLGYAVVGNMLSGIPTHVKNVTGTPMRSVMELASRFVAGSIVAPTRRALLGSAADTSSVNVRETVAYMEGNIAGLKEALHLGLKGALRGAPVTEGTTVLEGFNHHVPFAFSRERWEKWKKNGLTLETLGDALGVAYFGTVRTFGFRPSVAADEFNKALARRGEIHSLALRRAAEVSAKLGPGKEADKAFDAVRKGIINEPTAEAVTAARAAFGSGRFDRDGDYAPGTEGFTHQMVLDAIDVRQAAVEHAQLMAFQKTGPVLSDLERFLRRVPLIKHFSANFIRTPTQIFQAVFRDFNPLTAPVVIAGEALTEAGRARHKAFWDALRGEEDAMAGGGAAAEMVIARQIVGAGILAASWGWWASGDVVGSKVPEGEEYAGVLPYSVKLPNGEWLQVTGYSPLANHLALVADLAQIMTDRDLTDDERHAMFGALAVAVRNNVFSQSFMQGFADLMDVMEGGSYLTDDPTQTERNMMLALGRLTAGRLIPLSSFQRRLAQDMDPVVRDVRSFTDAWVSQVPLLTESLAAKRDFMGRPVIRKPGERGTFQAAKTSRPHTDPLEKELAVLASDRAAQLKISPTPVSLDGQRMEPHEHSRLMEIQGQLYRDRRTGRNMEEALRHLITTPEYRDADAPYRAAQIKKVVSDYRADGKEAALDPRSPFYMRELARRTGPERLKRYAEQRGMSLDRAFARRGRAYGLTEADMDKLRSALAATE